jgi:hypothetical protein
MFYCLSSNKDKKVLKTCGMLFFVVSFVRTQTTAKKSENLVALLIAIT